MLIRKTSQQMSWYFQIKVVDLPYIRPTMFSLNAFSPPLWTVKHSIPTQFYLATFLSGFVVNNMSVKAEQKCHCARHKTDIFLPSKAAVKKQTLMAQKLSKCLECATGTTCRSSCETWSINNRFVHSKSCKQVPNVATYGQKDSHCC